jgi:hypothetical protein
VQDDPTDNVIAPEDWEPHQVICRRALDEDRGNPWICGCTACKGEREDDRSKD